MLGSASELMDNEPRLVENQTSKKKFFERLFLGKIYVYCGTFIYPIDRLLLLFKRALLLIKWVMLLGEKFIDL